jgi:branched-chain amino acid transport system permease protein
VDIVNLLIQGVLVGGLYALAATGLSVMFGVMRIVNLAHGDFSVLAAFLVVAAIGSTALPVWLVVVIAVPLFGLLGYGVQRLLLNRAIAVGPLASLLVTFGLSIVIENLLLQVFSADTRTIDVGSLATAAWHVTGGISISVLSLITLVLAIAAIAAVQLFLNRAPIGRMMRAASDDREIASAMGADARHVYGIATAIAFATVALAGLMFAMRSSFTPTTGPSQLLFAFEAVVIGGLGSLWGTLAGGAILGVTQTIAGSIDPTSAVLAGHLVFLAVLAIRPQGLLPRRTV